MGKLFKYLKEDLCFWFIFSDWIMPFINKKHCFICIIYIIICFTSYKYAAKLFSTHVPFPYLEICVLIINNLSFFSVIYIWLEVNIYMTFKVTFKRFQWQLPTILNRLRWSFLFCYLVCGLITCHCIYRVLTIHLFSSYLDMAVNKCLNTFHVMCKDWITYLYRLFKNLIVLFYRIR